MFAVGVILASRGYPISSSKGQVITGIDNVLSKTNHFIFHSGTNISPKGELLTNGIIYTAVPNYISVNSILLSSFFFIYQEEEF